MSALPEFPEPDGELTISVIGREVQIDAYRASTMRNYVELCRKQALEEAAVQLQEMQLTLNTLDVLLEECKLDWSGDVVQIKAEHGRAIDALRTDIEYHARKQALSEAESVARDMYILGGTSDEAADAIKKLGEEKWQPQSMR